MVEKLWLFSLFSASAGCPNCDRICTYGTLNADCTKCTCEDHVIEGMQQPACYINPHEDQFIFVFNLHCCLLSWYKWISTCREYFTYDVPFSRLISSISSIYLLSNNPISLAVSYCAYWLTYLLLFYLLCLLDMFFKALLRIQWVIRYQKRIFTNMDTMINLQRPTSWANSGIYFRPHGRAVHFSF